MKTKSIYQGIALLAIALTTAACQNELNEDDNQPQPGEKIAMTIRAIQGTTPQTRTTYVDKKRPGTNGIVVKWEGGTSNNAPVEKLKLFAFADNDPKLTIPADFVSDPKSLDQTTGASITFTGNATIAANYAAIYPADKCVLNETDGMLYFDFTGQKQDCISGKEMTHLKDYDVMVGTPAAGTTDYTFIHQAIMLRYDLTLPTAESVTNKAFATSVEDGIASQMYASIAGNIVKTHGILDAKSLSLAVENHTASINLKAYMMIPDIDLDSEDATLTITVNTASGNTYTSTLNTAEGTSLTAGHCYTITSSPTLSTTINLPVSTDKLGETLGKLTPDASQTEIALTGTVTTADLTALGTFLKPSGKGADITTLDLSALTLPKDAESMPEVTGLSGSTKLVKVILPANAEVIGDDAFAGCTALKEVIQNEPAPSTITRATMPSGVKKIGAKAFEGCTAMEDMFLHSAINNVGNRAFAGCTALTALVFEGDKAVDNGMKLGTDILDGSDKALIFLPKITTADAAKPYKTALKKTTYYNFPDYGKATTTEDKVNTKSYTKITDGDKGDLGDLDAGGDWGGTTTPQP